MHAALNLWPYGYLDVNCLKKMLIINPLTIDLNSWYNVLNPIFKSHAHTHTEKIERKKKQNEKRKLPTQLYKNGHNWQVHKLCHLGSKG